MNYILKMGILYEEKQGKDLAKIKRAVIGAEKNIFLPGNEWVAKTNIRNSNQEDEYHGDVRLREYVMLDKEEKVVILGKPDYAKEENPDVNGWPATRVPRVDHADIYIGEKQYYLEMHNSQNYSLKDMAGERMLEIQHKGISGGWNLIAKQEFKPEILCGLFLFCRYIEQENELLII